MPVLASCSAPTAPADRRPTSTWSRLFRGGPSGAPALLFNSTVGNAAAGLAGLEYKLCGPNATISQKEASGLAAIVTAVDLLRLGRADDVGAGGMDAIYDIFYRAHDRFDVMSDAAAFDDSLAPFSRSRRGFVMGEGAFVLWLTRGAAIVASARSLAPPRRARTARSMPGPRIRSRSSARCRSRSRTPGCVRRTWMWSMRRPMRPLAWMRSKHVRSVTLFGGSRTDRDVDQGRDRRMWRVGRRSLRGRGALRSGRASAAHRRLARRRSDRRSTPARRCECRGAGRDRPGEQRREWRRGRQRRAADPGRDTSSATLVTNEA